MPINFCKEFYEIVGQMVYGVCLIYTLISVCINWISKW